MTPASLSPTTPGPVQVMGVVNVTDDSFSDGGLFLDRDRAVSHGVELVAQGAAIVDVGGESTRPGATRIDPDVETARVLPVVEQLAQQGITVSIDTMNAGVARAALEKFGGDSIGETRAPRWRTARTSSTTSRAAGPIRTWSGWSPKPACPGC